MMENTKKFNGKAAIYSKFRPDYPDELINDMISEHGLHQNSLIADIGSGTGILTKKLLDANFNVFAVEPNVEMRKLAEEQLKNNKRFISINGSAEYTTLDTSSVDFITVAQAFHWFDYKIFKKECGRILKPSGKVMIISNNRLKEADINQDIIKVYTEFCPEFHGFSNGLSDSEKIYDTFFLKGIYTTNSYQHPLTYNKSSFIGRHLSASYAPKKEDPHYPLIVEAFDNLFEKYCENGYVTLPNATISRCGFVKDY
ncbi:class I SAM-dependent methyltransferase [Niallia sp. NCCP-28]|uniref:class I SAM-dependent methyltransferase n=1 Tax=Niallia sp. NCCP-28 TaxID=2934712 RepID=UPI00208A4EC1|nr:class I SAM-dependent methyltransferase [Niallia sp. NCCP-28]GKU80717.1 methyltransferase [Niallia sp. NCCP-28]